MYTTQLDGTQNRELAGDDGPLAEILQEGQAKIQEVGAPPSLLLCLTSRPDANGNAQAFQKICFSIFYFYCLF
jgi:hypothetical protein